MKSWYLHHGSTREISFWLKILSVILDSLVLLPGFEPWAAPPLYASPYSHLDQQALLI